MKYFIQKLVRNNTASWIKKLKEYFFNSSETNIRLSFAVGTGIFAAIIPVWGFQNILAIILSFLFKLNKTITFIASNLSQPPVTPFIILASYLIGGIFINTNTRNIRYSTKTAYEIIANNFVQYLVGSIILALMFAIISFTVTYYFLYHFRKERTNGI
jgi:uncharacterized protein (DUF2062 family)